MRIAWTTRRSFPGPGGIASMMRAVAVGLREDITIWAARIDDAPVTRMSTTMLSQRFSPLREDDVEILPLPHDARSLAAGIGLGVLSIPGARRFANMQLRSLTSPPFTRALARGFADAFSAGAGRGGRFDLLHTWGGEHVNWAAGRAAQQLDVPVAVTPFAHPGHWGDDPQNAAFYRSVDAVLALVGSEAAVYERLGVSPERIHVTGVPVAPFEDTTFDVRAHHRVGDDPLVLFLGAKEPYKGYRVILEGMESIWKRVPETRFAFVGPHTTASESDFAQVRDPRVLVTGTVSRGEVGGWLAAADVFVLPSASEIFPSSILEAWQHRTAVVAGRWWCAHDVVDDGVDGRIVDPTVPDVTDALATLLEDPRARRAMADAGYRKVQERFTPAAVAARHRDAYRSATGSSA